MNKALKYFIISLVFMPMMAGAAQDLTAVASVNVTSDTAATAKNMAFNEARRQITSDVLSKYSNAQQLSELMTNTKDSVLTNLISSTNIDSERLSATTYSANIKMTVDAVAAKKWLNDNEVQNWLGYDDSLSADKSTVIINLSAGLRDWIELNRTLKTENLNLDIKRISGGQVTASFANASRNKLIALVRNIGWKYSDSDGYLQIWK
ncbi:MAG: hypothetical protein LBF37_03565 [Rickettsiales bacterium]|jgi:hypothetical protein|nr:hypothetical protein [Rickettsiales bacterium]